MIRAILCVMCLFAATLCLPARAADEALEPRPTDARIAQIILAARADAAEDARREADRLDAEWSRVRYGKVVGKKRGQSKGVNTKVNPAEFESRQIKIDYLDTLRRDARAARDRADWLADPECDWTPTLDLWRSRRGDAGPEVGQIGEVPQANSRVNDRSLVWPTTRLPMRILSTRPDGSAIVYVEVQMEQAVYSNRNPQLRPRIEYENREIGYLVLRNWPELTNKVTGDRLESLPGLWRVAGVSTYRSSQGSTYSTLVVERLDSEPIMAELRALQAQPPSDPQQDTVSRSATP